MTIGATGSPTVSLGDLFLGTTTGSSGTVTMGGGSLTVSGSSVIGGDSTGGTGTWTQTGGTVTFNNQVILGSPTLEAPPSVAAHSPKRPAFSTWACRAGATEH